MDAVLSLWKKIEARQTVPPRFAEILPERILSPLPGPNPIVLKKHYFAIVVEELFLAKSRKWQNEYDPMVLAVTEFSYDGGTKVLPYVIGPKLIGENSSSVPQGMLYRQARVAGIHPFRGGKITSTVVLCQSKRDDYARRFVKFVESVASAIPFASELATYTKYANSLLDGVDALFDLAQTSPLVGIRQEFDYDLGQPLKPSYYVLINGPEQEFPREELWVRNGNLLIGTNSENLIELRNTDYVLFSTRTAESVSDLDQLSFHSRVKAINNMAASQDDADWQRAKAELVTLLRELLNSPDLTREQAIQYHSEIVRNAVDARDHAKKLGHLSSDARQDIQDELRNSVKILDL
ncbi:hypothetical protein ACCT07_36430 [Rhizobium johnstonii]|uniref:hypothetical protein n=1 Tax=Rhizobium johnstonii TaxID=3019933 RepID=UPI003F999586